MSIKTIFIPVALLLFVTTSVNCAKKPPLKEDKFVQVYVDLVIAEDSSAADQSIEQIKSEIFSRHNITAEQYEKTIDFYNDEPKRWEAFFEKAVQYAEGLRKTE